MARRLTLVAACLALSACAEAAPQTLDLETVTAAIPAAVWAEDPSIITGVSCPDLVELPIAQSSVCGALLGEDALTIDIVVDEQGGATTRVREPLFDVEVAAGRIRERLIVDLGPSAESARIECEVRVMVARVGATVSCVADRGSDLLGFEIRLEDDAGGWSLSYAPG